MKLQRERWIERYGAAEIERERLRVEPCACDDPTCMGWQVVYPGQVPSLPTTRRPSVKTVAVARMYER